MTELDDLIPEHFLDAVGRYGPVVVNCEPHEWDNRTFPENTRWLITRLVDELRTRPVAIEIDKTIQYQGSWATELNRHIADGVTVSVKIHHDDGRTFTLQPSMVSVDVLPSL